MCYSLLQAVRACKPCLREHSQGGNNKFLLTPERELLLEQGKVTTKVQLRKEVTLGRLLLVVKMGLLTGGGKTQRQLKTPSN